MMSERTGYDLLASRRPRHMSGFGHRRNPRCRRSQRPHRRNRAFDPSEQRSGDGRRIRQARAAGPHRHACPCLPICDRPVRPERRPGRRALGRNDSRRPGRSVLHDLAGLPALRRRNGRDAHLTRSSPPIWSAASKVISIRTSIVRPASISMRPWPRRTPTRTSSAASRDTRRSAASPAGASASWRWRPRSAAGPISRSMFILERCGACRTAAPTARTRIRFSNASFRS